MQTSHHNITKHKFETTKRNTADQKERANRELLPGGRKVGLFNRLHQVGQLQLNVLKRVRVLVPLFIAVARVWVAILDNKVEMRRKRL